MAEYTERFWSQYGEEWIENKFKSKCAHSMKTRTPGEYTKEWESED